VAGGLAAAGTLAALLLALLRRPTRLATALALDERFGLKERVTTAVTLPADGASSPAAVALLADVQDRVRPLRVAERFPVRPRLRAVLVPVLALLLALLGLFYEPARPRAVAAGDQPLAVTDEEKTDLQRKLRQLQKKIGPGPRRRSAELQKLDAELDRLAQKSPETREQARALVKDMTATEDRVRSRERELAERAQALKEQMRQLERLSGKKAADGPGRRLERALDEAAFKKAREETEQLGRQLEAAAQADRLRKKAKDPALTEDDRREAREQLRRLGDQEMSPEQREQLGKQLEEMGDKLERLTRSEEARERLRQLGRQGLLDKDQLQRELDRLDRNDARLDPQTRQALAEVARKLAEARQALREGKDAEAARKLREAAELLDKIDDGGEGRELARQLRDLEAARRALCQALEGQPGGDGQGKKPGPGRPGQGGLAWGRRPESKDGQTGAREDRAHSDLDKGQLQVIDHLPGEGFKGPRRPAEMAEDVRRAAQEAPEAIDRQRLPKSAGDMARGYFEKLRSPK
jgi:hypothetical protein